MSKGDRHAPQQGFPESPLRMPREATALDEPVTLGLQVYKLYLLWGLMSIYLLWAIRCLRVMFRRIQGKG